MALNLYNFIGLIIQSPQAKGPPPPRPGYTINAPQLPIDESIWVLLAFGIIFGVCMVYRRNQITNKAA